LGHLAIGRKYVAQTSEQLTCFCPTNVSGPLFVILLIHCKVVKWICSLFLGHLAIGRKYVAQTSEQLTCFCPTKSWPQIQQSMTTTDQITISGPLFVILLIHWEVVKWICSLFLGHLAIGRKDCGYRRPLNN
jgi:hypothetical protein